MVNDSGKSIKQSKGGKPKKDQGHEFRCIPKTVAGIFRGCLDTSPEKRALERWKSQPRRLGMPLVFLPQVVPKELSDEDHAVFKFFQGKTQAQLGRLIMDTPVDTVENKRLFMRAFLLFVQKTFLLATSSVNVTPRAYPTLYDVENTKQRNWALHGLVRTGKLRAQKEKKQRKSKKRPSSESEWKSESETDTEGYVSDDSEEDIDSEDTRSKELVQRKSRPEPNPAQEERRSKRRHESNDATEAQSGPIHPTQEVIEVSSSSEDERPPLIPKTEQLDPYSSSAKIISEVLISMNRDEAPSLYLGIDPSLPQREEAPSFDLGIDPPLLTTQDLSDIEELDELVQKAKDQFQTPQPIKTIEN
ncbi:hypothetical protein PIB30_081593 [Stylosanthes scabra]|uniref:Uncharacterized protein n=1 Tax=Stylosanthes scabra TaxID=79078 RepID=A0ABU6SSF6_9FABA|nr:hypothetical protein [Stylosanthes scabra]